MVQERHIIPKVYLHAGGNMRDIGKYVQSINIQKSLQGDIHSLTATINPLLSPNTVPFVTTDDSITYWKKTLRFFNIISTRIDGQDDKYSFVGLIDSVYESVAGGGASRTVTFNASLLLPKLLTSEKIVTSEQLIDRNDTALLNKLGAGKMSFFKWVRGWIIDEATKEEVNVFTENPQKAIEWILKNGVSVEVVNQHNEKGELYKENVSDYVSDEHDLRILNSEKMFNPELTTYTGTLLEYIKQCLDTDFYEMYFDTATEYKHTLSSIKTPVCKMFIRTKPYTYKKVNYDDNSKSKSKDKNWQYWEDLKEVPINSSVRISENLGISEREVGNYFQLEYTNSIIAPTGGLLNKFGYGYPIIDADSITQYGLRHIPYTSKMITRWGDYKASDIQAYEKNIGKTLTQPLSPNDEAEYQKFKESIKAENEQGFTNVMTESLMVKRERVAEWHSYPFYESGQITIVGNEDITIGKKLVYTDKKYFIPIGDYEKPDAIEGVGMEYYITGVNHVYNYPSFFQTHLQVTRGIPKGDYVADWYIAKRKTMADTKILIGNKKTAGEVKKTPDATINTDATETKK